MLMLDGRCMKLQGRDQKAREQFERVLAVASDLGLLAEEYNVPGRHLAGNFPQALTHLAVLNAALAFSGPALRRGGVAARIKRMTPAWDDFSNHEPGASNHCHRTSLQVRVQRFGY